MPAAKRVRLGMDEAAAIDFDNPDQKVEVDKIKAPAGRDLPTIRQLKLRLARDEYVAGACFCYAAALSLHALRSQTPLTGADLRAQATIMYRERCGIQVKESALSVCRALEENNWDGKPWGGNARPFSTSRPPHRWEGGVVAYKHTKNNGIKVWPRHCCDVCCNLESGYGRSQSVPYNPGDGGSL